MKLKYVTSKDYESSPEWRSIKHTSMCGDGFELKVVELNSGALISAGPTSAPSDSVPIGSVEFCRLFACWHNIKMPQSIDYPDELKRHLGREITQGILLDACGKFVKPIVTKAFDAFVAPSSMRKLAEYLSVKDLSLNTPCWISDVVNFDSEWRVYVEHGKILGWAQYDQGEADEGMTGPEVDVIVQSMINNWHSAPSAYALDVGRTDDGLLLLVEVNDGWGTGFYPKGTMIAKDYARWCATRWHEIASH